MTVPAKVETMYSYWPWQQSSCTFGS